MRLSIDKKVDLLSVSIILFLTSLLSFHFIRQQSSALSSELDERATVLLNSLSINSEYPILAGDQESILRLMRGAVTQKDVVFCRIDNASGKPLAEVGSKEREPIREFVASVVTQRTREQEKEGLTLGVQTEAMEEIGKIRLGISLSGLNAKKANMERAAVVFAALTIVLVSFASSFLLKVLLRDPITALVKGTARIARGELDYRVPIRSNDEIGALATSFNKMVADLSKTLVSKNYVDNVIKSMTDTLVVTDAQGKIKTVNRATLDLLGYSENELVGKPISVLFGENSSDCREIATLRGGTAASNVEKTYVSRDGRRISMLFSSSVMPDDTGQIGGNVCVAQDITERREAEEMLARQAEELIRSNAQLEQANAELMKLDRLKSEFVSNVSHELRTPLTAVRAYAETLLQYRSIGEEKRDSFVQIILQQTERLSVLVEDLLDLSKIEAGEIKLNLASIDIEEAIEAALQSVTPAAERKGIEIHVSPSNGEKYVLADEYRLNQILINLLNNAVKFTESKGIVEVSSTPMYDRMGRTVEGENTIIDGKTESDQDKETRCGRPGYLRITVSDKGIGMLPEELERIFDKFKQVADKARGKPAGTGLGLSICRQLVEKMGGHIWVESRIGKGSNFHFTIPLVHAGDLTQMKDTKQKVSRPAGTGDEVLTSVTADPVNKSSVQ
jgi:PAS domain S-box-containing protein